MILSRRIVVMLALALTLAACAPRTSKRESDSAPTPPQTQPQTPLQPRPAEPNLQNPEVRAVDRAAKEAFHLMGLSYERTGSYDVSSLASNLELPSGVQWQLEDISETSYALRFTSDNVPDFAWLVTPEGVEPMRAATNRIL